jgi:hypothetical protein
MGDIYCRRCGQFLRYHHYDERRYDQHLHLEDCVRELDRRLQAIAKKFGVRFRDRADGTDPREFGPP